MKRNKISCEFWPSPCLQVQLRLKMTHLLRHGGENEHLSWFSSMQKAMLCMLLSCTLKRDRFNKWIARALIHLPAPPSLSYSPTEQAGRGQAEDLLPQCMLACILGEKQACWLPAQEQCSDASFHHRWLRLSFQFTGSVISTLFEPEICLFKYFLWNFTFGNLPCSISEVDRLVIYLIWKLIITILWCSLMSVIRTILIRNTNITTPKTNHLKTFWH